MHGADGDTFLQAIDSRPNRPTLSCRLIGPTGADPGISFRKGRRSLPQKKIAVIG